MFSLAHGCTQGAPITKLEHGIHRPRPHLDVPYSFRVIRPRVSKQEHVETQEDQGKRDIIVRVLSDDSQSDDRHNKYEDDECRTRIQAKRCDALPVRTVGAILGGKGRSQRIVTGTLP